jgi:hypothetical protein
MATPLMSKHLLGPEAGSKTYAFGDRGARTVQFVLGSWETSVLRPFGAYNMFPQDLGGAMESVYWRLLELFLWPLV